MMDTLQSVRLITVVQGPVFVPHEELRRGTRRTLPLCDHPLQRKVNGS